MRVIYCDNHLLAVEKPAGIETQGAFEEQVKRWVKHTFAKPGRVFLEPIHRLDKPVSGIVLFARTSKALSRLHALMRRREIRKTYHARVEGVVAVKKNTLQHHLIHGEFKAEIVPHPHIESKEAILEYEVIEQDHDTALLQIILVTGRYHQIRAQLAAIGHPILGDRKYGSTHPFRKEAIALSHVRMQLHHPVTALPIDLSTT